MDSDTTTNTNAYGSSKHRRQQLNNGIEILKDSIPLSQDDRQKLSQLQALHFACIYMRKQNLISNLKLTNAMSNNTQSEDLFKHIIGSQFGISDTIHGFIIAVSRTGHLIYVSDNVINYLGHSSIDVLLSADKFCDILHPQDESKIKSVLEGDQQEGEYEFYTSWYVSKIRRRVYTRSDTKVKISGRFIANNSLFVALCTPMLRVADRDYMDYLVSASPTCFTTVHSLDLRVQEICEKGQIILGYSENELQGVSLYEMANFKNLKDLRKNHKSLLSNKSQRGKLETVQLLMKNGSYLNCLVNMHYGNGNYIVCRYQAFSASEMNEYENYSSMILSYSSQHAFADDIDGSDQLQMSPSETSIDGNDYDQFTNTFQQASVGVKRHLDDDEDVVYSSANESDDCASNKRQRVEMATIKAEPYVQYQYQAPVQAYTQQYQQQQQQQFAYQSQPISPIPITDEMIQSLAAEFNAAQNSTTTTVDFDADNLPDIDWETVNDLLRSTVNEDNLTWANDDSNSSGIASALVQSPSCSPLLPQYTMGQQQQQQYQQDDKSVYFGFNDEEFLNDLLSIADDVERCY